MMCLYSFCIFSFREEMRLALCDAFLLQDQNPGHFVPRILRMEPVAALLVAESSWAIHCRENQVLDL